MAGSGSSIDKTHKFVIEASVEGAIPVKIGKIPLLLLVTDKGLVAVIPRRSIFKDLLPGSEIAYVRSIVKLSKMKPEELMNKLFKEQGINKVLYIIKRELIRYVELKRKFFGLGVVAMKIHLTDGKSLDYTLIYGLGTSLSKDEAVENLVNLLRKVGIQVVKPAKL